LENALFSPKRRCENRWNSFFCSCLWENHRLTFL